MALADFLGQFLGNFGSRASDLFDQLGQQAIGGPQGWAQQQENQRQAAQLAAQSAAGQQAQQNWQADFLQKAQQLAAEQAHQTTQDTLQGQRDLLGALQGGFTQGTQGQPGAVQLGSNYLTPPVKPTPFTYQITPEDIAAHPYLKGVQGGQITMDPKELPGFMKELGLEDKTNPTNTIQYEQTLNSQLPQLLDQIDPGYAKTLDSYKFAIHDALHPLDGGKPDFKQAAAVIDSIRKNAESLKLEKAKQALSYSPEAISGAARKSGAEMTASLAAQEADTARALPDSVLSDSYERIKSGQLPFDQAARQLSLNDRFARRRWLDFLSTRGETVGDSDMPSPLSGQAQQRLLVLRPAIDSLVDLRQKLRESGADKSNAPLDTFFPRLQYALGITDKNGGLVPEIEMDKIRAAGQALPPGSNGLALIEQAQIHTPSSWKDSGALKAQKIDTLLDYMNTQKNYILKYGNKYGIPQTDKAVTQQGGGASAPPATPVKGPVKLGQGKGHWDATGGSVKWVPE